MLITLCVDQIDMIAFRSDRTKGSTETVLSRLSRSRQIEAEIGLHAIHHSQGAEVIGDKADSTTCRPDVTPNYTVTDEKHAIYLPSEDACMQDGLEGINRN